MRRLLATAALAFMAGTAHAAPAPDGLTVERVVIVMRHGVRPPTKAQPMPAGVTPETWPSWPVEPGFLSPHGALAVERLGASDGATLRAQGVIPAKGCPTVRIVADSDQRTIETAKSWARAFAPGCAIPGDHQPQGSKDTRFGPIQAGLVTLDPAQVDAAVAQGVGPGGMAAVEAAHRDLLALADHILCKDGPSASCGIGQEPSVIAPASARQRPKMEGALDRASTVAQIMLLEYGEGKPMAQVGWGRVTPAQIARLSALHALEFRLLARPYPVASANLSGLLPIMREGLTGSTAVTMISGHDTNVANLGGLLDLHWQVPGLAQDDPAPGGAIVLERVKARDGKLYVRASYRAQSLEQIRSAAPLAAKGPYRAAIPIPGCAAEARGALCPLNKALHLLGEG
ncbi:histidine-type phosphatase [Novosphingobium rosa]|uniref:histidine-type phosphatase n=1 Tax=Novosphingobium rosa TaxID=76978 RepID=UPI000833C121|nr:histidine-type phosphatase [Novosphingobium rosa]